MTTFTIEFSKRWPAVPTLMPAAPAIVCQSSIGSSTEVADVDAAAAELTAKGHHLIHGDARTEPWGQITARLLSPEGLLVAVCYTPAFQDG